jgi:type II restriction enzyme
MANIKSYNSFFGFKSHKTIVDAFIHSLLTTNRTYDFFVDWEKVQANIEKFKIEIGILSTLTRSRNVEKDLEAILLEYPKTAQVLPLLIAMRDKFDVLENIENASVYTFDFSHRPTPKSINKIMRFVKRSGIASCVFERIKVLYDYLYGVEVGLDTNARKNRSGKFMEAIIGQSLEEINQSVKDITIFPKGNFRNLAQKHGVTIPQTLRDRTPDYAIRKGNQLLSIEVNFYSGQGSKPQEIVDAYLNRQRELKHSNWEFIWITDGNGWRKGQNQISKAIQQMDYVLNLSFVKQGFLKHVIEKL